MVFVAKNGEAIVFRPEKASDTEMLWAMFSTLSEDTVSNLVPPFTRERVESWTNNINYDALLAIVAVAKNKNAQRIIASAALKFNPQEVFQHKADFSITVHDDYQNLGVGTALMQHLLGIAKAKKLTKICLTVNTQNSRAIHLYTKMGFEREGTLRKETYHNSQYRDVHQMALFL
jgi:ribosomal protein S18 acetylase RimI-like enzyme